MGEWHKVEKPSDGDYPCARCNAGWSNYSAKEIDGELYTKTDSCHETCLILKRWRERKEK